MRFNLSRKVATTAAFAMFASLGLAACGGGSDAPESEPKGEGQGAVQEPTEPTTVTFFSWVGTQPEMKKLAAEFNDEHPNITIKFENVPAEQAAQVLSTRIAGNNAPDVAYVNASDVADYAARGAAADLANYIARSEVVKPDDYVQAFRDFVTYDDKMWGLPMGGETTGLFYRTDMFEAAGIDAPPVTWEEFEETAAALTDESKNEYGFEVFAPESAYYFQPWLYQAGGTMLSEDGTEVEFTSDEARRAAEFYVDLAKYSPPDYLNSNSWDGRVAFAEGQVGMYMAGAWFAGTLTEEFPDIEGKWATAPLPEGEAGCKTSIAGDSLLMLQQTENADASWLWMEFLSRPETLARLTYKTEGTLLPPLVSLLEGDEITQEKPVLQGFIDLMPCGVAPIANPKYPRIEVILNEQLGKAMYGEQTSDEALDNTAQEAEAILARG